MKRTPLRPVHRFPTATWLHVPAATVQFGDTVRYFDGPEVNVRRVSEVAVAGYVCIEGRLPVSQAHFDCIVPESELVLMR